MAKSRWLTKSSDLVTLSSKSSKSSKSHLPHHKSSEEITTSQDTCQTVCVILIYRVIYRCIKYGNRLPSKNAAAV